MRYAAIIFSFLFIQIAAAQDYIFIDSDEGNGPVYEWIDIIELVNQLESPQEDDYTGPFDIGFEFPFYENTFDQFYVGSNGMIGFVEEGMANQINHELPDPGIPNNVIAWFWMIWTLQVAKMGNAIINYSMMKNYNMQSSYFRIGINFLQVLIRTISLLR